MECIQREITSYQDEIAKATRFLPYPIEQVCFFDIETTGLSPKISSLYLLGACYFQDNSWHMIQWFADDYVSEKEILLSFASLLQSFPVVIHYNGATFDIPYLEKKYLSYHLSSPFDNKESMDLYRQFPHKKRYFPIPDEKLTTVEKLLGFHRQDTCSGKDCIRLYTDFMQKKYARDNRCQLSKNNLLNHNQDDLIGTIFCSWFLSYLTQKPVEITYCLKDTFWEFKGALPYPVPASIHYTCDPFSLNVETTTITLQVSLNEDTLYHYFEDYQNYYYLPEEDTAIHKSVGTYVDPSHRKKATASNCYIKRTGTFLALPAHFSGSHPVFKKTRRSSKEFLLVDSKTCFSKEECENFFCTFLKTL